MPEPLTISNVVSLLVEDPYELPTLIGLYLDRGRPTLAVIPLDAATVGEDLASAIAGVALPAIWDAAVLSAPGRARHLDDPRHAQPVTLIHAVARTGAWETAVCEGPGVARRIGGDQAPVESLGRVDDAMRTALGLPRPALVHRDTLIRGPAGPPRGRW